MRKLALGVIAVLMLVLAVCGTAYAHGSGNTSDDDNDGNQVIRYYKLDDFSGTRLNLGIDELNRLHNLYPNHAPEWKPATSASRAEILIEANDGTKWQQNAGACDNAMWFRTGADLIVLDRRDCLLRKPMMHEGGHALGMYHHDCTDYWLNRSVMVQCSIRLDNWGSDDLTYAQTIPFGK